MVILQKAVEIWLTGEAVQGQGNPSIQDQRARRGSPSVVTFAEELDLQAESALFTCPTYRALAACRSRGQCVYLVLGAEVDSSAPCQRPRLLLAAVSRTTTFWK